jgi:hypothetical protein|tara:strand:- start:3264 stop:3464 length:201 start_codon:yes stop_codon:yes gene_type:complete
MPVVGDKTFPYTPKGMRDAAAAKKTPRRRKKDLSASLQEQVTKSQSLKASDLTALEKLVGNVRRRV